jgi:hypothetical protein
MKRPSTNLNINPNRNPRMGFCHILEPFAAKELLGFPPSGYEISGLSGSWDFYSMAACD